MIPGPGCSGSMITAAPTLWSDMKRAASRRVRPGVIVSTCSVIASRTFTAVSISRFLRVVGLSLGAGATIRNPEDARESGRSAVGVRAGPGLDQERLRRRLHSGRIEGEHGAAEAAAHDPRPRRAS